MITLLKAMIMTTRTIIKRGGITIITLVQGMIMTTTTITKIEGR